jgi:hypothetical protein
MSFIKTKHHVNEYSRQGSVHIDYSKLVKIFGEPSCTYESGKVRAAWFLTFEMGILASIYDWSDNNPLEDTTAWSIGGIDGRAVSSVIGAIAAYDVGFTGIYEDKLLIEAIQSPSAVQIAINEMLAVTAKAMLKPTVKQIKQMAELAHCFVTADGLQLKISSCGDDMFYAENLDRYTDYEIEYGSVTFEGGECFMQLVKMEVPTL